MDPTAALLRGIAERVGLPHLRDAANQPDVKALFRITFHYVNAALADSVATLTQRVGQENAALSLVYVGLFNHRPLLRNVSSTRATAFYTGLHSLHFDTLPDSLKMPIVSANLWLVERAAGGFYHGVVLAPDHAQAAHAALAALIREHLPESLREVPR